ncbi:hypothetical protein [Rhodoplanes serenus]|uniref:hypothetical protein n=1 Tax=Rhodoplanes serenus TaxID=200615 RepID=UPI0011B937A0|nr:hypothetical protein [Rhodoplanes serenus]
MIFSKYERFFLRHDLAFRTPYDHGRPLDLVSEDPEKIDVQDVINRAIAEGRAELVLRNKDIVRITKLDVRPDIGTAVFLFRRSDPDASTPMWEDQATRAIREADKKENDALTVSSHLFVELISNGGPRPMHRALLEEVPGLGRTYVHTLLSGILRSHKYNYKDRRGVDKETNTLIDFEGIKSENLNSAIGQGSEIEYIELVKLPEMKGLDTEGLAPREVRWKLYLKASPENAIPIINRVKKWSEKEWKDVRVRINMPEDRSRMVSVARAQDAADVLFVRAVPVTVTKPMKPCTDVVNEELLSKALEVFKSG